jgi:uncharacterized membrane protein (UPF0127 family)
MLHPTCRGRGSCLFWLARPGTPGRCDMEKMLMRVCQHLSPVALALVAALLLSACGSDKEDLDAISWDYIESTEKVTVNGKEFDAYVASTDLHRRRAIHGLATRENQIIVLLYPQVERPVDLEIRTMPDPIDLVFVDADSRVLRTEAVPAFSQANFPRKFGGLHARVVLMLPKGAAAELNLTEGESLQSSPDLVARSEDAEGNFARVFFMRNIRPDDKPVPSPYARVLVAEDAEEASRLLKDRDDLKEGEGVLVPLGGRHHEFWMKEIQGEVSAAYLERGQQRGSPLVVSAMFEGLTDEGDRDLDRPVYYSPGKAEYLVMIRGGNFFTRNRIERRSIVSTSAATMDRIRVKYDDLEIKVGDRTLNAWLAREADAREFALRQARSLRDDKAIVLAWDDPSFIEFDAPEGAHLWYVGVQNGRYSIVHRSVGTGGPVDFAPTSRFVIAVPPGFGAEGDLKFPYALRDLKPSLPAVVFYQARQADAVTDRWPGPEQNFKARARVELAITPSEQRLGLMFRESLKPDHGMIFIYERDQPNLSFWMKNCLMNLSIAYVNDRGVIVNIHNSMVAPDPATPDRDLERYESDLPARFAIEMEEGWFERHGIEIGDRVFIPPALTARD